MPHSTSRGQQNTAKARGASRILPKLEELLEVISRQGDEVGAERLLSILEELEKDLVVCQSGVEALHASSATVDGGDGTYAINIR